MYLDYSKLAFDKNGTPETPTLVLKTMHEETIGVIPGVYNLKLSVKFAEPSEMTFDVPAILDGEKNWIYDELVGYKVIYTEHYGIYVVMNPTTSADGISDVKHVQCYSLEKVLDTKKFFLEDGDDGSTFKFFNQTNHNDPDTIIGRVLEVADGWHMTLDTFKELMKEYRAELQDNDCGTWSKEAREWAISNGLINGTGTEVNGEPNYAWADQLTREQAAALFYRFAKLMGKA